jgi:hypothetical protein
VKIDDIFSCTQELIGGGEFRVMLIKLGLLICLMPTGMEHCVEGGNGRATEAVSDKIYCPYFILDVEMELL